MEIERKFTVRVLPEQLSSYDCLLIEQGYLSTNPVVRVRRQDMQFYLTYKGKGMLAREEYNLPLTEESYLHLLAKADGNIITKNRYLIPIKEPQFRADYDIQKDLGREAENIDLKIELDIFKAPFQGLIIAEVEFPTEEMANAFIPPEWFLSDVTMDSKYHNSNLSKQTTPGKAF